MIRLPVALLVGLLVSSCAPHLARPSDTAATIYVLNTIPGRGTEAHPVMVDGNEVAALRPRQYTWFRVEPGAHAFSVSGSRLAGSTQSALELTVAAGTTRYLVYDEEQQYSYLIEYAEDHARRWLRGARYVSNDIGR